MMFLCSMGCPIETQLSAVDANLLLHNKDFLLLFAFKKSGTDFLKLHIQTKFSNAGEEMCLCNVSVIFRSVFSGSERRCRVNGHPKHKGGT